MPRALVCPLCAAPWCTYVLLFIPQGRAPLSPCHPLPSWLHACLNAASCTSSELFFTLFPPGQPLWHCKSQKPQPQRRDQNPSKAGQAVAWVTSPGDGTELRLPCAKKKGPSWRLGSCLGSWCSVLSKKHVNQGFPVHSMQTCTSACDAHEPLSSLMSYLSSLISALQDLKLL